MNLVYGLPIKASPNEIKISQGWNGPWSHKIIEDKRQDSRFAIDFAVPVGTEVLAAMDGVIEGVFDRSNTYYEGGDPKVGLGLPAFSTNLVTVRHNDGTLGFYLHFAKGGVRVEELAEVKKGDVLGVTGMSGWIGDKPHLHFQVFDADYNCLPVRFEGYTGPLEHDELYPKNPEVEKE